LRYCSANCRITAAFGRQFRGWDKKTVLDQGDETKMHAVRSIKMKWRTGTVLTGAVLAASLALSGCIGGTTYGTGVSQGKQTVEDVYNMFTLKRNQQNIDYTPRADLIVPENSDDLPEPLDSAAATSNPAWPESPEHRIARIRSQAGEIDERSGEYSIEEQLRPKEGIAIEQRTKKFVVGQTDRDGNPLMFNGEESKQNRREVLERKAELAPTTGVERRFLTDPPVAYRVPAESAPSGPEAYSDEEIADRKKKVEDAEAAEKKSVTGLLSRD
jgi:hypothetical protein